jgi:Zn-dependent protease with chaperone function
MNQIFIVERGSYGELGRLLITVSLIGLVIPIATVLIVNRWSRPRPAAATS